MTLCVVSWAGAIVFRDATSGCINGSGVNQQNWNTVLYWIHAAAFAAFQAGRILVQDERLLTNRANQDVEQILRDHDE